MEKERLDWINGLKGYLCITLLLLHSTYFNEANPWYGMMFRPVEGFMVLSGFGLAYGYKERFKNGGVPFQEFFKKRYMGLMPLYWITDSVYYLMVLLGYLLLKNTDIISQISDVTLPHFVLEFLGIGYFVGAGTPINVPLWAISFFLVCYIIFYLLMFIVKKHEELYLPFLVVILILCLVFSCEKLDYIFPFVAGLFIYELYNIVTPVIGKIVALVYMMAFCIILMLSFVNHYSDLSLWIGENWRLTSNLFFVPMLVFSTIYLKPVKILFSCKAFVFLGRISMSAYMWHMIVFSFFEGSDTIGTKGSFVGFILSFIGSIVVATISYYVLEPRIKRLLRIG